MRSSDSVALPIWLAFVVAFAGASCGTSSPPPAEHPIADSLESAHVDRHLLRQLDALTGSPVASRTQHVLATAESTLTIRPEGESQRIEAGATLDAVVDSASHLYLLDGDARVVREFAPDGRQLATIGHPGTDPGALVAPTAVALIPPNVLYVADSGGIHVFSHSDGRWIYRRTIAVGFAPSDICVLRDRLYAWGLNGSQPEVIHEVSPDGQVVRSFGRFYRVAPGPIRTAVLRRGHLACLDGVDEIVAAADILPEVHAFAPDGHLNWITRLGYWRYPPIVAGDGRRGMRLETSRANRLDDVAAILQLDPSTVLIDIQSFPIRDGLIAATSTVHAVALDAATGRGAMLLGTWPLHIAADGTHLFSYSRLPPSRATVWRRSP